MSDIENIWKIELEILDVIDTICKDYNLKYSLAYGSLIGAVRHGGFIPWDDDIDIVMPREDYEKLILIWNDVAPKEYILQNNRTDLDFTQNFTKIRRENTTFLQYEFEKNKKYHKGIFVDIFPGDRVAKGRISCKVQYVACAINLLYSRGFVSGSKGMVGIIEKLLLKTNKKKYHIRRRRAEKYVAKYNGINNLKYMFPSTIGCSREYYSPYLFDNMTTIEFCGKEYMVVDCVDEVLRTCYGDYMKLPQESERIWTHHPIILDFEHSYEELVNE